MRYAATKKLAKRLPKCFFAQILSRKARATFFSPATIAGIHAETSVILSASKQANAVTVNESEQRIETQPLIENAAGSQKKANQQTRTAIKS